MAFAEVEVHKYGSMEELYRNTFGEKEEPEPCAERSNVNITINNNYLSSSGWVSYRPVNSHRREIDYDSDNTYWRNRGNYKTYPTYVEDKETKSRTERRTSSNRRRTSTSTIPSSVRRTSVSTSSSDRRTSSSSRTRSTSSSNWRDGHRTYTSPDKMSDLFPYDGHAYKSYSWGFDGNIKYS